MTDIVPVVASVLPTGTGLVFRNAIAGEAITQGQSVYVDTAGVVKLASKDLTIVEAAAIGIAVTDSAVNQPCEFMLAGSISFGSVLATGTVYIVGAAPGGIAPDADAIGTEFVTVLGVAISSTTLQLKILQSGVAHA